jgi:hypothetical protein
MAIPRHSRVPWSVVSGLIITVVTLALWSANLIDHNAVAGILLTSQVVNVVAFFGSEIFKKGFLIWAVKVVMASLLFIVASSIALETSWEFVDLIFGRSVVSGVPWYKHIDAISQDYTPFVRSHGPELGGDVASPEQEEADRVHRCDRMHHRQNCRRPDGDVREAWTQCPGNYCACAGSNSWTSA